MTHTKWTAPGMLPIHTMTTVINRLVDISEKSAIHSHSRGKYRNVVLINGHLHILFNFLNAIGQHMENTGLVDVWVEAETFAENSTDAMMEGKAYYRAVRGHTLTYEALWQIYLHLYSTWLRESGRELDVVSKVDVIVQRFQQHGPRNNAHDGISNLIEILLMNLTTHLPM